MFYFKHERCTQTYSNYNYTCIRAVVMTFLRAPLLICRCIIFNVHVINTKLLEGKVNFSSVHQLVFHLYIIFIENQIVSSNKNVCK